jgi:hypothetical protein
MFWEKNLQIRKILKIYLSPDLLIVFAFHFLVGDDTLDDEDSGVSVSSAIDNGNFYSFVS